jgi:predicted 2-oxoglutarate/Fe(II)-dependent dioxygenase YbiX
VHQGAGRLEAALCRHRRHHQGQHQGSRAAAEEFEGGDLRFPEYGRQTYRPPTGGAVVFSCSLLHEATPVTKGRRYAFLPFLYDEAAAKIREENLQFLDESLFASSTTA